jgi:hypothetical protein
VLLIPSTEADSVLPIVFAVPNGDGRESCPEEPGIIRQYRATAGAAASQDPFSCGEDGRRGAVVQWRGRDEWVISQVRQGAQRSTVVGRQG